MKKYLKYVIFFLIFLVLILLFGGNNTDIVWNYGVSHALRIGELPYRDYNSIVTPLYQFIMSIGLFIHDSYLIFVIEQALLCVVFIRLLEVLIGDNYLFIVFVMFFPIFYFILPNYNFLVVLLYVYILYLEKEKKSDSIIGVVLGLLILTKQNVGIITLIFSLFAAKDIRKSLKRLLFSIIPICVFLIYLGVKGIFLNFIDLCFLGMFDFASNNKGISYFFIPVLLVCFIYIIYSFLKKKDFLNYYLIPIFTLLIPIVDFFHFWYFLVLFVIVLFMREPINNIKIPKYIILTMIITIFFCNIILNTNIMNIRYSSEGRMKYVLVDKSINKYIRSVLKKYNIYDNVYMLSMNSMYFDLESNNRISFFDIPLYGNFGYNGLNKMKRRIDSIHDAYFFVLDSDNRQYAIELNEYVRKKGMYIDNVEGIEIYYMK